MVPSSVAASATTITERAPATTRENTSRPTWSVPNQWVPEGALLTELRSCSNGVYGPMW